MMKYFTDKNDPELVAQLKAGAIGIIKTDTIYGLVASAEDKTAVDRVFAVRGRERSKACIILAASVDDIYDEPTETIKKFAASHWPGPVSIAIQSPSAPGYLKFKDGTIAYRVPDDDELRRLLKITGPLIAPSANPSGELPASCIDEAREYFGDMVDFYVDSGAAKKKSPSQLWKEIGGKMARLR